MAEFQEVMKQAKRMCEAHDECNDCALKEMADAAGIYCPIHTMCNLDFVKFETAVMNWAAEHPEPRYPSWNEAWKQLFPDAREKINPCPGYFISGERLSELCDGGKCGKCRDSSIPADIAEKLGIKPIGGK